MYRRMGRVLSEKTLLIFTLIYKKHNCIYKVYKFIFCKLFDKVKTRAIGFSHFIVCQFCGSCGSATHLAACTVLQRAL